MTCVEFFDKDSIENICACLANKPDRVIDNIRCHINELSDDKLMKLSHNLWNI